MAQRPDEIQRLPFFPAGKPPGALAPNFKNQPQDAETGVKSADRDGTAQRIRFAEDIDELAGSRRAAITGAARVIL